jgi:hypothetical protein
VTALRDSGIAIVVAILSIVAMFVFAASFSVVEDLWAALTRGVARRLDPPPPPAALESATTTIATASSRPTAPPVPTPSPIPTESEAPMRDSDARDDQPLPIPTPAPTPTSLEGIAVEAEAAAERADEKALFADHDNAAMPLRIGAMERELQRLKLVAQIAGQAAETARDHQQAAEYTFLWGAHEYFIPEYEEALHTHRRWRLLEQAKASATSRRIESEAANEAVRRMTREVDAMKARTDEFAARAKRAADQAKAARQLAKLARAAADAAAEASS